MSEPEQPLPSWQELLDLIGTADASGYAEFRLDMPGLSVVMSRASLSRELLPREPSAAPPPLTVGSPTVDAAATAAPPTELDPSLHAIRAPILGVAYLRPAPDAAPFVNVGDAVGPEDTIAIIEVMKMMNPVAAGMAGVVERVCVASGDMLEHGDVIALIRPSEVG